MRKSKLLKDYMLNASSDSEFLHTYEDVCKLLDKYEWNNFVNGRFSFNLIFGLIDRALHKKNIGRIIEEIQYLEGKEGVHTITKPATSFEFEPLKGLWHKHYNISDINSFYFNLIKPLNTRAGRNRAKDEIKAVSRQLRMLNSDNLTIANEVTKRVFNNYYSKLVENKEVTGEWIIYHIHKGEKYYLAIGEHDSNQEMLARNIKYMCSREFPDFRNELPIFEY